MIRDRRVRRSVGRAEGGKLLKRYLKIRGSAVLWELVGELGSFSANQHFHVESPLLKRFRMFPASFSFRRTGLGFVLVLQVTTAVVFAQGGLGLGSQLQGLGSSSGGLGSIGGDAAVRVPSLGIPAAAPPTTWSTPGVGLNPLFEPIDEDTYIIGPGDNFHVGTSVRFFNVTVGPEGYLVMEGLAPISVTGLTLKAARARIVEKLSRQYRGDAIQVTLSQAKRFQVLVAGFVNRPGLHAVEYGARVSHALEAAGGYSVRAARTLTLQRANGEEVVVDLRGFFVEGDLSLNPLLRQGDRIIAPEVGSDSNGGKLVYLRDGPNVVAVTFVENETLEGLVSRYDNFRDARVWTGIRVYDEAGKLETEIPRDQAALHQVKPGSTLEIRYSKGLIFIGGMVMRPGYLEYNPNLTAMDYLAMAGIIVGTSDVRRISVLGSDGKKRKVDVARELLLPGDHILVPRSVEATLRDHIAIISAISSLAVAIATFVVLTGG